MSDDDGYGYSPYDDFEDMLYDADPAPDLADDLAEHALHSPVYQDTHPGHDLLEYHSDWEYYSDDYFDDDPELLRVNPQDGTPAKPAGDGHTSKEPGKRGRKRKILEMDDSTLLDLGERKKLRDCIKGTVWAQPIPDRKNLYLEGDSEKVALLKDWQRSFGTEFKNGEKSSSRPRIPQDESWANDMSLADMGLSLTRSNTATQDAGDEGGDEPDEEAEDEDQIEEGQENATIETAEERTDIALNNMPDEHGSVDPESELNSPRTKRRKKTILPSPPTSGEVTAEKPNGTTDTTGPMPEDISGITTHDTGLVGAPPVTSIRSRKRKASEEANVEEQTPVTAIDRSTASSRAKRVASSKAVQGTTTKGPAEAPPPVPRRITRSRKK